MCFDLEIFEEESFLDVFMTGLTLCLVELLLAMNRHAMLLDQRYFQQERFSRFCTRGLFVTYGESFRHILDCPNSRLNECAVPPMQWDLMSSL